MLIGVLSDTHRCGWAIEKAVKKLMLNDIDMLIHLGDNVQDVIEIEKHFKGKIINVKGNCDSLVSMPSERIEVIENKKFFITHGNKYEVKHTTSYLKEKASEIQADVVLYGHTHISSIIFEDGIWFINPGSPAAPRDGFPSAALVEIVQGEVKADIIEI